MKKKKILLELTSFADGEEILRLVSVGKMWKEQEHTFLEWEEDPVEKPGQKTVLCIKDSSQILIAYSDPRSPTLVLESGKKCLSVQPSPLPFLPSDAVGYTADSIRNTLTESGGGLTFAYTADYHMSKFCRKVDIQVSELGK